MQEQHELNLSALLDGELEPGAARDVLKQAMRSDALRSRWETYVLIGDRLRNETGPRCDIAAAVMAKLHDEPVVLSPGRLPPPRRRHALMTVAASLAGIAVVGWVAFAGLDRPGMGRMERTAVFPAPQTAVLAQNESLLQAKRDDRPVASSQINEYLIAHHTQAATFRLGDSPEHVRAIALTSRSNHK